MDHPFLVGFLVLAIAAAIGYGFEKFSGTGKVLATLATVAALAAAAAQFF